MTTENLSKITVQQNDTLGRIARRSGFTVEQISSVNPNLVDINRLNIGEELF